MLSVRRSLRSVQRVLSTRAVGLGLGVGVGVRRAAAPASTQAVARALSSASASSSAAAPASMPWRPTTAAARAVSAALHPHPQLPRAAAAGSAPARSMAFSATRGNPDKPLNPNIPEHLRQTGDEPVITETLASAADSKATATDADDRSPLERAEADAAAAAGKPAAAPVPPAAASAMKRVPLTQPFIPITLPDMQFVPSAQTRVTTLPSGLRVATHESASPIANVGVFVDTGSRYETPATFGINHFIEHMAFKSTLRRSDKDLVQDMGRIGANVMCTSFRELTMLSGEVLGEHVGAVVDTFADIISRPAFKADELAEQRALYREAIEDHAHNAEALLLDAIHAAAYKNNTIANPQMAPAQNLDRFTADVLRAYSRQWFTPSRAVVVGLGVPHALFVEMCAKAFADLAPDTPPPGNVKAPAVYTGGDDYQHSPELTDGDVHFALAFETASWHHPTDLVPMCVLQMMMGGGGSFSAGGPGKGMYSRLYSNVLNVAEWCTAATAFNSIHSDSSLFGITGSSKAASAPLLVEAFVAESRKMAGPVDALELARAKNQLSSSVFMQLESRALLLEDIGRQLLTYNRVQTPHDIAQQIAAVTAEDVQRVALRMLESKPSYAAVGDLSYLPNAEQITMRLLAAQS